MTTTVPDNTASTNTASTNVTSDNTASTNTAATDVQKFVQDAKEEFNALTSVYGIIIRLHRRGYWYDGHEKDVFHHFVTTLGRYMSIHTATDWDKISKCKTLDEVKKAFNEERKRLEKKAADQRIRR